MITCVPEAGIKGRVKQVHPTDAVGCNYFYLPLIPAFGTEFLKLSLRHISATLWSNGGICWGYKGQPELYKQLKYTVAVKPISRIASNVGGFVKPNIPNMVMKYPSTVML